MCIRDSIEHTSPPAGRGSHRQIVLHTLWGGRVNRPFATALGAAWEARFGMRPEIVHGADCVVVVYPSTVELEDPFAMVEVVKLEELLRRPVERTGFFGARFREAAGRALLLPRAGRGKRVPLWVNRQRAKELLEAVRAHDDFPLVLEAWRCCLQDEFELEVLRSRLDEIADGRVAVRHVRTETPSPFTAQVAWKQTNELMYEDDVPTARSETRPDLVREMALASHLRPRISPALASDLETRLHRLAPGWSPRGTVELLEWIKERILIPHPEWIELLDAIRRDHEADHLPDLDQLSGRAVILKPASSTGETMICAVEMLPKIEFALSCAITESELEPLTDGASLAAALEARDRMPVEEPSVDPDDALAELLGEWLRSYGPVDVTWVGSELGIDRPRLDAAVGQLRDDELVVLDELNEDADTHHICERVNH